MRSRLRSLLLGGALLAVAAVHQDMRSKAETAADEALLKRLETLLGVMRQARDRHVARPEARQMLNGAVRGMLAQLDPETAFYTPAEYRALRSAAQRLTADIGVVARREPVPPRGAPRGLRVVGVIDDSPAAQVGLRAGDIITHVNGDPAGDLPADMLISNRLAAEPGRRLELWVRRGVFRIGHVMLLEAVPSAGSNPSARWIEPGRLLLTIPSLEKGATAGAMQALAAAGASAARPLEGLVLDLRNLARGSIEEAVAMADAFLESGTIVQIATRRTASTSVHGATPGDVVAGKPLVVLVNSGTAGAGEVLAAALQENRRGAVVGTTTAGRGSAQSFVPVGRGGSRGMLYLTTERYLGPAGRSIDKAGLKPDLVLPAAPVEAACRDTDLAADTGAGLCERRPATQDPAVRSALSHFAATATVAVRP